MFVSTSLSPNIEKDDILLALKLLFKPRQWKFPTGPFSKELSDKSRTASEQLEEEFKRYFGVKYAFSFNSGRSALMAILNSLDDIHSGEEVLLQAFTCNAAINPIINAGAKPVFVDIDDTLNLDPIDLRKKVTYKSKVVMVQHTFGWPAQIENILDICKKNNLVLIEDCAHSLGAKTKGKFCGTFGEAAFFSFGRDKIISSVFGGMAITNNEKIGKGLKIFQQKLKEPSNFWIFQQLLHPILMNYLILPSYGFNQYLGKAVLGAFHKLSLLSKAVYKEEKRGKIPQYFPKRFPQSLAILALNQFKKLEKFNVHRREIARIYEKNLMGKFRLPFAKKEKDIFPIFLRYPILVNQDTDRILEIARKKKFYLDDGWRKKPIVPPDTQIDKMNYSFGSCSQAEKVADSILNLPTHINISEKKAKEITNFLKEL